MGNRTALRATVILAALAAILALSAAAVTYSRKGELDFRPIGGGLFMVMLAIGAWSRLRTSPAD